MPYIFLLILLCIGPVQAAEIRQLDWDDLMPANWAPQNPFDKLSPEQLDNLADDSTEANRLMQEMQAILASSPVVENFNGERVKLPGFPIPLEGDGERATELLLVPYFGACIHTPPPPANQIVYVRSSAGLVIEDMWQPVWIIGTLHAQSFSSAVGDAGYTLDAESIEIYTGEE